MKRLLCLAAVATSIACHSTPPTPSAPDAVTPPAIAQFAGAWTGEYRITSTQGSGYRPGTVASFTLRLDQTGDLLRGNFQTDSGRVLIDVTGFVDDNGIMSLQGSAPGLGRVDFVGAATLTRFRARIDPASGLTGDLEYRLDRTAETRLGFRTVYTGDIASAQRHTKALLPLTFDGTWEGSFVVRTCSRPCSVPFENEIGYFRLNLRQSGSSVTGIFWSLIEPAIEVRGHVEGGRLILEPSATGGTTRILSWSTEADHFGRMTGAFTYEQRGFRRDVQLGTVFLLP